MTGLSVWKNEDDMNTERGEDGLKNAVLLDFANPVKSKHPFFRSNNNLMETSIFGLLNPLPPSDADRKQKILF